MRKLIVIKSAIIMSSFLLPGYVYSANVVNDVGDGISNAANNVGKAVKKAGENVSEAASDTTITTKIKAKLALESDIPMGISVKTNNGVVTLEGTVATGLQANRIIEIAQSVDGVTDVNDSRLDITDSKSYMADATLTAKAKGKLLQLTEANKIGNNDLDVETTNGDVHIFGNVSNKADVVVIKKAISNIKGVHSVKTNIDVVK